MRAERTYDLSGIVDTTGNDPRLFRNKGATSQGNARVLPFLKWAGGKRWLLPLALDLRKLQITRYFEPFLGSGAMFFGLAPQAAFLSDTNADLIGTYRALQHDSAAVLLKLREHDRKHSAEYYYYVRALRPRTCHTKAAQFIYLNRTCWNGLYRVNRAGVFNTPVGTKAKAILETDDFERVAARLQTADLAVADFQARIDLARAGDLVFADPPYTVRHQHNGFIKYNEQLFSWSDQERLCLALSQASNRGASIICTNADHASIRELYGRFFKLTPITRYSAIAGSGGARGNYSELLITG